MMRWYDRESNPIYITLTEEHLENIRKELLRIQNNQLRCNINHYLSECLQLENNIKKLDSISDVNYLEYMKNDYKSISYRWSYFNSISEENFLRSLISSIEKYGHATVKEHNFTVFETETEFELDDLKKDNEELNLEFVKYGEKYSKLRDEYIEKTQEKLEELENQIQENKPNDIIPKRYYTEPVNPKQDHDIVGVVLIVGLIILGMAFGFYTISV